MPGKSEFFYDKRLTQRFIKRGLLSRAEFEQHLRTLADVADKAAVINTDEPTRAQEPPSSALDERG